MDISLKANDYANPNYIGSKFRKKRFKFFEQKLEELARPVNILDIGGTVSFWVNEGYHKRIDVKITIINIRVEETGYPNIHVVQGDACDLSQFKEKQFDIAFSNSLIEHLFTKENQQKMAREAMRVAKNYFIQTPNKYFPIEPHFKFPLFQFMPKWLQVFLQTRTHLINGVKYDRDYAESVVEEIKLLSRAEMEKLFPQGEVYVETFIGLPKSFVLHSFK
ncbi:MAG TPA: class I SAM-dependent methyltransferase [Cyclobacteriaceae bacterium]|nr:class I SAM-dependent methyltransferase [Cyclobacteriaceae bacterium]